MDCRFYYYIDRISYSEVLFAFTTSDGALSFKMSTGRSVYSITRFALQAQFKVYRIIEKNQDGDKCHIHL
jgi:hypothetical protein